MKHLFDRAARACAADPATLSAVWLAALLTGAGTASASVAASAPGSLWHMNGGSCTPTGVTMRAANYWTVTGGGRVKYRNGESITPLTFTCPVAAIRSVALSDSGTIDLVLHYQDPDGTGSAYRVQATLKSRHKATGAHNANLCRVVSGEPGPWASSHTHCFNKAAFDPATYLYWVEATVTRTTPGPLTVEFNGAELRSTTD